MGLNEKSPKGKRPNSIFWFTATIEWITMLPDYGTLVGVVQGTLVLSVAELKGSGISKIQILDLDKLTNMV
jgi:hypothetical protein